MGILTGQTQPQVKVNVNTTPETNKALIGAMSILGISLVAAAILNR